MFMREYVYREYVFCRDFRAGYSFHGIDSWSTETLRPPHMPNTNRAFAVSAYMLSTSGFS
jgi:hypothetical protein